MRVVLATVGTRGDVQPMLALAQALTRRGHSAIVACPESFGGWVRSLGLEHAALGEDLSALMREKGADFQRSLAGMKQYFAEQLLAQAPRLLEIAEGADAIVGTAMAWSAPSIAEKRGLVALELFPSSCGPSREHPPPMMPFYGWPRWVNGLLWWVNDRIQDSLMGSALNAARARRSRRRVGDAWSSAARRSSSRGARSPTASTRSAARRTARSFRAARSWCTTVARARRRPRAQMAARLEASDAGGVLVALLEARVAARSRAP